MRGLEQPGGRLHMCMEIHSHGWECSLYITWLGMIKQRLEDADLKCSQKAPVYYIVGVFQVQRLNALHSRQLPGCLGPKPVQLKAQHKTRGGEGCIWGPRVVHQVGSWF